ncbi:MAG: RNA methyltransferase [Pseudomonadota bacterium]
MSGTDHSSPADWSPDGPYFVLVQPQMGENIGAAARGMWNFGLRRMRIVDPRDGWPNPAAVAMASGAGALLDDAQIFPTTAEAVADAQVIYATTARTREMTKRVLTPEAAMAETRRHIDAGRKVAVLFGPERAGLGNADVVLADAIISVPVNPAFASLNLAQCVLLTAYEWRRQRDQTPAERLEGEQTDPANAEAVGKLFEYLETELDRAGFFFPEDKKPAMTASLENLLRRAALTDQDARTLWGVIRALAEGPKRRR